MGGYRRFAYTATLLVPLLVSCGRKQDGDDQKDKRASTPVQKNDDEPSVQLSDEAQRLAGIGTQTLTTQNVAPQTVAYGRLEEDPSASFVLRAPIAGNLRAITSHAWPSIGQKLGSGTVIGLIEARFTPSERIGLNTQLTTARSEMEAATASVAAASSAYERARILNADNRNVADRVVQDAEAHLRAEEAREKSASDTVRMLTASIQPPGSQTGRPLVVERSGDVVELLAQPGEAIEPGSPILRIAQLDRLLARVDIPLGERVAPSSTGALIQPAGFEDQPPLHAVRIAFSATTDPKAPGASILFRLDGTRSGLRPGLAVVAYLTTQGVSRKGMIIPQSAVVRVAASPYVYVATKPGRYERRGVSIDQPLGSGYYVTSGFAAGDRIVTVGAQTLLSQELKSQLKSDEQ